MDVGGGLSDFWSYIREPRPHRWAIWGVALALTWLIFTGVEKYLIPYEKPGSEALFSAFRERIKESDGFLLKNHGPIVPGKTMMDAFCSLEELEESARIAWELYRAGLK